MAPQIHQVSSERIRYELVRILTEGQAARGNHNGGVIRFGPDRRLYVIFGDQGRRSQLQNLPSGPTLTPPWTV